jgi:hypothetical protein
MGETLRNPALKPQSRRLKMELRTRRRRTLGRGTSVWATVMKARRDWSVLWYAAVLAAAIAWGYAPPAETEIATDAPLALSGDKTSPPANSLELRRVAQHMILR